MAQQHLEWLSPPAAPHLARRRAPLEQRAVEKHVVVATQDLPRMSPVIQALVHAGYLVTVYASPTRLLPRLQRLAGNPVALLVIDGSLTPAFARAAAILARATYADLPILLLADAAAARRAELMPPDVSVLRLPLSAPPLLAAVAALTSPVPGPADARTVPGGELVPNRRRLSP
jgi:hypothetical protein